MIKTDSKEDFIKQPHVKMVTQELELPGVCVINLNEGDCIPQEILHDESIRTIICYRKNSNYGFLDSTGVKIGISTTVIKKRGDISVREYVDTDTYETVLGMTDCDITFSYRGV